MTVENLVGKGCREFEALAPDRTRVSFRCEVRSNRWPMHIAFLFGAERGHNMVYQEILAVRTARVQDQKRGS